MVGCLAGLVVVYLESCEKSTGLVVFFTRLLSGLFFVRSVIGCLEERSCDFFEGVMLLAVLFMVMERVLRRALFGYLGKSCAPDG